MSIEVTFIDSGRYPSQNPDPKYPNGKLVNVARPEDKKTCTKNLPYPAPRCGFYKIKCVDCSLIVAISVAGRPDDPNVVTLPCKQGEQDGKAKR